MKKQSPFPAKAGSRLRRENYTFAVGRVRALEKFLLKQEVFEEALESSLNEALRLFAETVYSDEILHVKNSQQLEAILDEELRNLKKLVTDLILDKKFLCLLELGNLRDICELCKIHESPFLKDYLMYLIDMHNIKSFLRLYILNQPQAELDKILTCEGFIKKKDLLSLYPQDLTAFLNRMEYVHQDNRTIDYTYYLGGAIQRTVKEKSFIYLEKAINDFLIRVLKPAKYIVFGPEPILAFYFAKLNEINLMRMIILGKLNNVPTELVKERLNSVYA